MLTVEIRNPVKHRPLFQTLKTVGNENIFVICLTNPNSKINAPIFT